MDVGHHGGGGGVGDGVLHLLALHRLDVVVGGGGGGVGDGVVLHLVLALHALFLLCQWASPLLLLLISILIAGVPEHNIKLKAAKRKFW